MNKKNWWETEVSITKDLSILADSYNKKYGDYDYACDARAYDSSFAGVFENILNQFSDAKKVLVTGANDGYEIKFILKMMPGVEVYAVDISSFALNKLMERFPKVKTVHADMEDLSLFTDKFFDLYVSCRAMHSTNVDVKKALGEAIRVSKNIVISVANGYLKDGAIQKGLWDYPKKIFDLEMPYTITKTISNFLTEQLFNITTQECSSEIMIVAKSDDLMKIAKQYDYFHETYTDNFSDEEISIQEYYKAIDFDLHDKKLLDVGCGDAVDLITFSADGASVYGIDPSIEFLKKAKKNNPTGIFIEAVGEKIPFEDASFDVVTSKWAMQTCTDIPKTLSEMGRVLKKGGVLVYLTKHPIIQFLQKIRDNGHGADYYKQKVVTSNIYEGKIMLHEPSHTISEYFNTGFFNNFEVVSYFEGSDFPISEQLNGDIYPTYMIVIAKKK